MWANRAIATGSPSSAAADGKPGGNSRGIGIDWVAARADGLLDRLRRAGDGAPWGSALSGSGLSGSALSDSALSGSALLGCTLSALRFFGSTFPTLSGSSLLVAARICA
mmetsp:Transcript_41725/g.97943  ORF Transcript_41725/g.97943 Transcript_41725/m.97943 type:complete len:109 (+) Transcript_41725:1164-1490(+)